MKVLSERIRASRKEKQMSQAELAVLLNTTNDTVSLWELGKRDPSVEDLKKLCEIFNVSSDYLLCLSDFE